MKLLCCGINHQTASIVVRERFSLAATELLLALQDLQRHFGEHDMMAEIVIVSTCNRFEIYSFLKSPDLLIKWLANYFKAPVSDIVALLYVKCDQEVVQHAMRVAAGLDSMIIGESQILGQMKCAYAQAGEMGLVGQQLGHLFTFVFSAAKKIRSETAISHHPVSIAYAAVVLAKKVITAITEANILLIGAGETIELAAEHLSESGAKNIIVANRTLTRAEKLAKRFDAKNILIGNIPDYIADIDIIITSTASQLPLIGKGLIERAMQVRAARPLFIVDIAVPRDVEPEVAEIENVHLYNIDDLKNVVEENKKQRQQAALEAEKMILVELENFQRWEDALESVPTICAYRQHVEQVRDTEVQKALNALAQGKTVEQVIHNLARGLTNKLMHNPSVEMRKASSEGRDDLLQWSKQLLGIQAHETLN